MMPRQLLMEDVLEVAYRGQWMGIVRRQPLPGRTTDLYAVVSREPCVVLAEIRWYAPWRRYAFFPELETVWEPRCLDEITAFLRARSTQQRQRRREHTRMEVLA